MPLRSSMSAVDFTTAPSGMMKGPGPRVPVFSGNSEPSTEERVREVFRMEARTKMNERAKKKARKRRS